jgi:hypothetical protein
MILPHRSPCEIGVSLVEWSKSDVGRGEASLGAVNMDSEYKIHGLGPILLRLEYKRSRRLVNFDWHVFF